jgi:hypothetical protein
MAAAGRTAAKSGVTARSATPRVLAMLAILLVLRVPADLPAQTVEAAPIGGYRFGGDFFELATNRLLDLDGAPVVGGAVNIEMSDGLWFGRSSRINEHMSTSQTGRGSLLAFARS